MKDTSSGGGRTRRWLTALSLMALSVALVAPVAHGANPKTKRVSVKTGGAQTIFGNSFQPSISSSGRFVAFWSGAPNLIGNDSNGRTDIFVRDRKKNKTKRVSVKTGGGQANNDSFEPSISANGRYVAFVSVANDLIGSDNNAAADVFVHDRQKKKTRRVSVRTGGGEVNSESFSPAISGNGRFVAFDSNASTLVGGDGNNRTDVFVHDRQTKKTKRVSVKSNGAEGTDSSFTPSISGNGRFVAFASEAPNLVGGDNNGSVDVFVRDRQTGKTKRVSVKSNGAEAHGGDSFAPSISADGRFVAFQSDATNLVSGDNNGHTDIFVHDRKTKRTRRVSVKSNGQQGNDPSRQPSISGDGRFVVFESKADNLVSGDTNNEGDVFIHDRNKKRTKRVSVRTGGGEAQSGWSRNGVISADARFVAFTSGAINLVNGDTNALDDVFVRGPLR